MGFDIARGPGGFIGGHRRGGVPLVIRVPIRGGPCTRRAEQAVVSMPVLMYRNEPYCRDRLHFGVLILVLVVYEGWLSNFSATLMLQ